MELRDILRVLRNGKWILIILPFVAMLTSGIFSFFIITPVYRSSTTLMVGKTYSGENGPLLQYNDILTANQLVKTYSQIAKSRTVAEKVIELEKLDLTPGAFSGKIDVQPVRDTQLIQISIDDPNPNKAARLANVSGQVFIKKVVDVMKLDNVNIVDPAVPPQFPEKPNKRMNIMIAGVVGLMAAVGLIFLMEFLDQTIKSSEDINRYLELPVLGVIPRIDKN